MLKLAAIKEKNSNTATNLSLVNQLQKNIAIAFFPFLCD